jgi:hypothetical protein
VSMKVSELSVNWHLKGTKPKNILNWLDAIFLYQVRSTSSATSGTVLVSRHADVRGRDNICFRNTCKIGIHNEIGNYVHSSAHLAGWYRDNSLTCNRKVLRSNLGAGTDISD